MMTNPEPQHLWLKRFVGTWKMQAECMMGPDQPPMKSEGIETVRMLGDLWIIAEARATMPGCGEMSSILTLGYDPTRRKFVGTWIGSPMAHMFVYEGELNTATNTLPLNTTGPSFTDPTKTSQYQDTLELKSDNLRELWSQALGDDGKWLRFMTATYTRI